MTLPPLGLVRPELLPLLLLVVPLVALVALAERARRRARRAFAGSVALTTRSDARLWLKQGLLVAALAAVLVALAGPYVDLRAREARRLGVDIVLAVDVSQSMAARDVQPDRLRAARHVAQQIGERLIGSRVSLVLFAGGGATRYPATSDPRILGEVLDNSGKGLRLQQGSSLAAAIEAALAAFPVERGAERGRAIVVVSDGEVTLGGAPDVATLVERGVRVHAIGVGTPAGAQVPLYESQTGNFTGYLKGPDGVPIVSRLDERALRDLATSAGGRYWRFAGDDGVLGELVAELRTLEAIAPVEDTAPIPDERSRLFIAFAVAAVLAERLLSDRRRMPAPQQPGRVRARRPARRILGVVIGSSLLWAVACADAAPSLDEANRLFAAGDFAGALERYRQAQLTLPDSPEIAINSGNTLHLLGRHQDALGEYAHAISVAELELRAVAQYDRGNTLFRLGRLEDARDAYRESLRLDPSDRDAKFNLEVVERMLAARQGRPSDQPGQQGSSGPSGASGSQGASGAGSPQPGSSDPQTPATGEPTEPTDPSSSRESGTPSAADLREALLAFREDLTLDEALRVLRLLESQTRGIEQLIEGPRRADPQNREY